MKLGAGFLKAAPPMLGLRAWAGPQAPLLHSQPRPVGCAGFPGTALAAGIPERGTGVVTRPAWVLPGPPGQECQGVPEHAYLRPGSARPLGASVQAGGRLDPAGDLQGWGLELRGGLGGTCKGC